MSRCDLLDVDIVVWKGLAKSFVDIYLPEVYIFDVLTFGSIKVVIRYRLKSRRVADYPDDFKPEELLEEAFGVVYDDPITVKIHFSAGQARYIRERTWAKGQKINEQKDGSIILTMKTSGWWDVRQWIFSFGPDAELLEPVEKRDEMKGFTQKTASLYVK